MKIRLDFVTNSSSSSFLICKKYLTDDQVNAIRYHDELGEKLDLYNWRCYWHIDENDEYITGYTDMNNFSMSDLFSIIRVPESQIWWGEFPFDLDSPEYTTLDEMSANTSVSNWEQYIHEIVGEK